jgi:hypothetical protein
MEHRPARNASLFFGGVRTDEPCAFLLRHARAAVVTPKAPAGPAQLIALLVRMAQNKLAGQARFHHRERRDARKVIGLDGAAGQAGSGPSPSRLVAGRDLLEALRSRLTPEERELADRRGAGQGWAEIAAAGGGRPPPGACSSSAPSTASPPSWDWTTAKKRRSRPMLDAPAPPPTLSADLTDLVAR